MARARRRTPEEMQRARELSWWEFGEKWYALYTTCTACGEVRHSRGRTREAVKCWDCHNGSR